MSLSALTYVQHCMLIDAADLIMDKAAWDVEHQGQSSLEW